MSLLDMWNKNKADIDDKLVQQIIAFAGEGKLNDGNKAQQELSDFFSNIPLSQLKKYAEECITTSFDGSGFALQDIINQIGSRLGYKVIYGRYRGTTSQVGFDGLWMAPEGYSLIIEVKKTDAYRIHLDTIEKYRRKLINEVKIEEESSFMLIVVGRQDTGDLEAQIRGSKHAWDLRLISIDALLNLADIKEDVDDPEIEGRIRAILVPREYTRLDGIIDIVFSTTEEIKQEEQSVEAIEDMDVGKEGRKFTPVQFKTECIENVQKHLRITLIKRSRALFTNSDKSLAVICSISREYEIGKAKRYWFAFHDHHYEKLSNINDGYIAFGCGSAEKIIFIYFREFEPLLSGMNQTHREKDRFYWHVHISDEDGQLTLLRKEGKTNPDITKYLIK